MILLSQKPVAHGNLRRITVIEDTTPTPSHTVLPPRGGSGQWVWCTKFLALSSKSLQINIYSKWKYVLSVWMQLQLYPPLPDQSTFLSPSKKSAAPSALTHTLPLLLNGIYSAFSWVWWSCVLGDPRQSRVCRINVLWEADLLIQPAL